MKPLPRAGKQDLRLPEHGRIRFGEKRPKNGKTYPAAIDTFRFTSPDREAIAQIAHQYGGTVAPWDEPRAKQRHQWQVTTTSAEIDVWVPPNQVSTGYELWASGGRQRSCDGDQVRVMRDGPEGLTEHVQDCICWANQEMECTPKTRMTVILPQIRFGGGWRLETGSWDAFHEIPTMEQMLQSLQANGMIVAKLALVEKTKMVRRQKRVWKVPTLRLAETPMAIASGQASVAAITAGSFTAMTEIQVEIGPAPVSVDEDVIDAEVIEDGWDIPPAGVLVKRNPNREGPKWIRK